jgi:uncharacterized protein (UPF0332 family)
MKLERCFEGTPDISPNLIERDVDAESASDHIDKAEGNLHAAKLMGENKIFDWQIVCSYYAMYHATMASLLLVGLEARSHECAIAAFKAIYVKREIPKEYLSHLKNAKELSKNYSNTIASAKTERLKASYGIGEIKSAEASKVMSDAKEFVIEIKKLVHAAQGHDYIRMKKE